MPGKDIALADALSRINQCAGDTIKGLEAIVHETHLKFNASPTHIKPIRDETVKDVIFQKCAKGFYHEWISR